MSKVLVVFEMPGEFHDLFRNGLANAIDGACVQGLLHSDKIEGASIGRITTLGEDQTFRIVPIPVPAAEDVEDTEPAAAGDEEVQETILVMNITPHPDGMRFVVAVEGGKYLGACGRYEATCVDTITSSGIATFPSWMDAFTAVDQCYVLVWSKD